MNKKKKLLTLLLVAVMSLASAFCMFPTDNMHTAHADDSTTCTNHSYKNGFCVNCDAYEPAIQIGTTKKTYRESLGNITTITVPVWQVYNAGQLYWVANNINENKKEGRACDIVIADDICINENLVSGGKLNENNMKRAWTPIIDYYGHIRGNGYSISGLYLKSENDDNVGFVNSLNTAYGDATISNLNIFDSWFEKTSEKGSIGSLVGWSANGTIENCYVDAVVKGLNDVGGIVGTAYQGFNISNCCFAGSAYGTDSVTSTVGGILGSVFQYENTAKSDIVIKNCSVTGTVDKVKNKDIRMGILVGDGFNLTLVNCHWDSAKNIGIDFVKFQEVTDQNGELVVPGILEQTNCTSKTAAEFANGTVCQEYGRHISHEYKCLLCSYACNHREYEDGACKECSHGYVYVKKIEYTDLPTTVYVNSTYPLIAEVVPYYAKNNGVEWSVVSGKATIVDNNITFNAVGEVKIKATVKNGRYPDKDYTETHTVKVLSVTDYDVKNFSGEYGSRLFITYTSGDKYTVKVNGQSSEVSLDTAVSLKGTFKKNDGESAYGIYIEGFTAEHPLNLKIDNMNYTAFDEDVISIKNATVNLTISGTNVLTATNGAAIYVNKGSKLTIDGTGSLKADASANDKYAGIGSGYNNAAGEIIINSGTIEAKGGESAAGIGGGKSSSASKITINGGNITAIGGNGKSWGAAAGIGGGASGNCGTLIINGGTVNATGGSCGNRKGAAGIGNGAGGKGGTITINGGNVTATGKSNAAGIGGGTYEDEYNGGSVDSITITGGTINAKGDYLGAGIGGGMYYGGGKITITGGNIKASSSANAIGSGGNANNKTTSVVNADGENVSLVTITLDGATANTAVTKLNGISYGLKDVVTHDTNKIYCYISSGKTVNSITAGETEYVCKDSSNTYYTDHDWSNEDGVCARCGKECSHPKDTNKVCDTCGKKLHTHSWFYRQESGSTIIKIYAYCKNDDRRCDNTDGGSVTVKIKDYYYTGSSPVIEIEGSFTNGATYTVKYDSNKTEVAPSDVGRHTIYLNALKDGNDIVGTSGYYNIYYLPVPEKAYTIVNGYKSESVYWFNDGEKIKIAAPEGYTISTTLGGTYGEFVELSEDDDKVIYLKNADGQMTDAISVIETLSFDKTAPTGTISISEKGFWQKLINKISFGLFFKNDTVANVTVDDAHSGVKKTEYFIADKDLIGDDTLDAENAIAKIEAGANNAWKEYNNGISLNKNAKNVIYVKITDNVGNVAYINSEGIVMYTDAENIAANAYVWYKSVTMDLGFAIKYNSNTVKSLANGDEVLTLGKDYTVGNTGIFVKAEYVNSLNGGTYTFTVTYNPLGLDYVDSDVNDKPNTTSFTITIAAIDGSVSDISDISKTYDGTAVENPTFTSLSKGEATYEYKPFGANDDAYTTVAPKDAGKYVVRITVAGDCNYNQASSTAEFTIAKANVTVKADSIGKIYGDSDPSLTWCVTNGTVFDSDTLNITIERESGEDVNTYTVTASETSGANPNYDITFETGEFTIGKRTIGITWKNTTFVYDGTVKSPTAEPTNTAFGDNIELTLLIKKNIDNMYYLLPADNVGNYSAMVTGITGEKAGNYQLPRDTTTTFVINKADQNAPDKLIGTPEDIDGRANGKITGLTDKMEYRKENSDTYIRVSGTVIENLADGTYYVRYAEDDNHNASPETEIKLSNDKKLTVKIPSTQKGYTVTVDKTALKWNESFTITFTLKEGYSKLDNFAVKVNGKKVEIGKDGKGTVVNVQTNCTVTVDGVADITAPTAEVILGTNKWNKFFNSVTFGLFFKNTQSVEIVAKDTGSGVDKIYYYLSTESMSEQEVTKLAADKWIKYEGAFNINPQEEYIIYAKVTDRDGNAVYVGSEHGIIVDTIAPVISGITDGETYYGDTEFTIIDKNIDFVTVDGDKVELADGKYTIVADGNEHTIVATDKSGNSKTVKITVITIASIDDGIENITKDNVKSSDEQTVRDVLDFADELINSGKEFTEDEKKQLEDIKANAQELLDKIDDNSEKIKDIIDDANAFDKDNIKSDDKKDIQDLIDRITDLNKTENVTEEEKAAMEEIKKEAENLVKTVEDVENDIKNVTDNVNGIDKDKVNSDDKQNIQDLIKDIEDIIDGGHLNDAEKEQLNGLKDTALDLIEKIDAAASSTDTENTDKVNDITTDNVRTDDKSDLENAKSDLEKALDDYGDNLTESEKKDIQDDIDRINEALDVIEKTEKVEEIINKLPSEITKADSDAIQAADDAYNSLTDYEQSILDDEIKQKLDAAKVALEKANRMSHIWLWIVLIIVCVAVILGVTIYGKNKKRTKK